MGCIRNYRDIFVAPGYHTALGETAAGIAIPSAHISSDCAASIGKWRSGAQLTQAIVQGASVTFLVFHNSMSKFKRTREQELRLLPALRSKTCPMSHFFAMDIFLDNLTRRDKTLVVAKSLQVCARFGFPRPALGHSHNTFRN